MTSDNEDILELIEIFEQAEKNNKVDRKVELFKHAINLSSELIEEFPEFKNKIKNIRKANIRSILLFLSTERPDIDLGDFIDLILIFLNKSKQETREVIKEIPSLKKYLVDFTSLWAEKTPEEVRTVISSELFTNSF